ncbi:MAG: glycosyltransferase [Candidatus Omnitrophota bacterium]|jgi:glycosyltransferase involved in cell wall biosynthesis
MKKVLFITYSWPPKGGVGVMRALKFVKYLPKFGWMPTVLTTDDSARASMSRSEDAGMDMNFYKIVKTGYEEKFVFLPDRLRKLLLVPDTNIGWLDHALKQALKLHGEERFDVIFSMSPPSTAHMIGRLVKEKTGLPWIADMRDLWSDYHFEKEFFLKKRIFSIPLERKVLKDADLITIVSSNWARALARTSRVAPSRIRVVTNGFDEEDFNGMPSMKPEKFTMGYTGKLNRVSQDPEVLFEAVSECVKDGSIDRNKIDIEFYTLGFEKADISGLAGKYKIDDIVKEHGPVDYKEALRIQKSSSMLLFFQWKGASGWYSAKIFEYLGSRRPIIVISEKDSIVNGLVRELNAGFVANSKKELKEILLKCYNEHKEIGFVASGIDEEKLKSYTRSYVAQELAGIFNELRR